MTVIGTFSTSKQENDMAELEGVHVFKRGYKDPVYTAARQYIGLEKSIEQLKESYKTADADGFGEKYKKMLLDRIHECEVEMHQLEVKFSLNRIEEFKL